MKHPKNDPTNQPGAEKNRVSEQQAKGAEPTAEGAASTAPENEVPAGPVDELETMKIALEEAKAKYDQLNDMYLRTLAEYDNYRKRTIKEKAELIKSGGESVIISILNVV